MKSLEFITALNSLMDTSSVEGAAASDDKKKGKASTKAKQKPTGRSNGLQSLSTLGLTYAHLSKRTIVALEVRIICFLS
jgi:hypothetical protein